MTSRGGYHTIFFVVGEMRSGTSWLRRMLAAHPEIACGSEGSFFGREYVREEIPVYVEPVASLARSLWGSQDLAVWHGLPWNQWSDGYEEDVRNLLRASIDYFLSKEVARTGKRIVGDKSPQHTGCVDEIHQVFPDARVVHIVRDGRDVAVSSLFHWWRLAKNREGGVFVLSPEELERRDAYLSDPAAYLTDGRSIFTDERLEQLARRWSDRVGSARGHGRRLYRGAYVEVSYENLLDHGAAALRRVVAALGADSGEKTMTHCLRAGDFTGETGRERGLEDPSSFLRKGVAGDWVNYFTERDREIYERVAGETLQELGYLDRPRVRQRS
jgi:hypothetical protein